MNSIEENEMLIEEIKCCQTDEDIQTLVDSQCFDIMAHNEGDQLRYSHQQLFKIIKLFRDHLRDAPADQSKLEKEMDDFLTETALLHFENNQQKNKIISLNKDLGIYRGDMSFVSKLTLPQLQNIEEQLLKTMSTITIQKNNLITLAEQKRMETKLCVICFTHPYSVLFKPCGHVCVCEGCSMKIDKCPIDRSLLIMKKHIIKFEVIPLDPALLNKNVNILASEIEWAAIKLVFITICQIFNIESDDYPSDDVKVQIASQIPRIKQLISKLSGYFNTIPEDLVDILRLTFPKRFPSTSTQQHDIEGFDSNNEEDRKQDQSLKSPQMKKKKIVFQAAKQEQNSQEMEEQIKQLTEKLSQRDQTIEQMTSCYLKDVQHLKEMVVRKENKQETFDVSYFDNLACLTPEAKEIVNSKIKEIQQLSAQRVQDYVRRVKMLEDDNDRLRGTITTLAEQNSPQQLIKLISQLEKNPYKIWKLLQDQFGNKYFFSIFENAQHIYGINYKEIDSFIQGSQASARLYVDYKQMVEEQMVDLIRRTSYQLNELNNDLNEKQTKINLLKTQLMELRPSIINEMKQVFYTEANQRLRAEMFKEIREVIIDNELSGLMQRSIKRSCIIRWSTISRRMRKDTQQQPFNVQQQSNHQEKTILNNNDEMIMTNLAQLDEIETLKSQNASYEFRMFQQDQYIEKIRQEKRLIESCNKTLEECLEKCVSKVTNYVDMRQCLSEFERKLDQVVTHRGQLIEEVVVQHKKTQQAFNRMFNQLPFQNKEVMTDIHGTKYSLSFIEERDGLRRINEDEQQFIDYLKKRNEQNSNIPTNGKQISTNGKSIPMNGTSISMNGKSIQMNGQSIQMNGKSIQLDVISDPMIGKSTHQSVQSIAPSADESISASYEQKQTDKAEQMNQPKHMHYQSLVQSPVTNQKRNQTQQQFQRSPQVKYHNSKTQIKETYSPNMKNRLLNEPTEQMIYVMVQDQEKKSMRDVCTQTSVRDFIGHASHQYVRPKDVQMMKQLEVAMRQIPDHIQRYRAISLIPEKVNLTLPDDLSNSLLQFQQQQREGSVSGSKPQYLSNLLSGEELDINKLFPRNRAEFYFSRKQSRCKQISQEKIQGDQSSFYGSSVLSKRFLNKGKFFKQPR